jgi:hypothetical protein
VAIQGSDQPAVVFEAQPLEGFDLFRKVSHAVEETVGDGWVGEAAVAARSALGD